MVDRNFGERISALARSFHVWVVDSPDNAPVIRRLWGSEQSEITSFAAGEHESPEDVCARIAGDLDEHHGEHAHDPPWSEIEIFGAKLSPRLQEVFAELGAESFVPTPDGFICRRAPPS